MTPVAALLPLLLSWQTPDGIDGLKAEPNLEKRSDLALAFAQKSLDAAQKSYQAGEIDTTANSFADVKGAITLSWDSLVATGKNPRKSPKFFKRAEIQVRKMLRRLGEFRNAMSVDDRPMIEELYQTASKTHDRLLSAVMSKK